MAILGQQAKKLRSLVLHQTIHIDHDGIFQLRNCPELNFIQLYDCAIVAIRVAMDKIGFKRRNPMVHGMIFDVLRIRTYGPKLVSGEYDGSSTE